MVKKRTLSQNRKIAKDIGMSLTEVKALDAEFVRRQKEIIREMKKVSKKKKR
jgi:hypothetical protein